MSKKRLLLICFAGIVLIASWLYPPWIHYVRNENLAHFVSNPRGYFFLFDDFQDEVLGARIIMKIDWQRLVLTDLIIVAVASGILISTRPKSN